MDEIKIAFVGDIVPGGILSGNDSFISSDVLHFLQTHNIRVGTLESAIGDNYSFDTIKMNCRQNIIYSKDDDLSKLDTLNIDVVTLGNNHAIDLGPKGLKHTISKLEERDILYCGAGVDQEMASKPAVINLNGVKIAFLAYCYIKGDIKIEHVATKNSPGLNPLYMDKVEEDIKRAKALYEYVFVLPHWGNEYTPYPNQEQIKMANRMIEAGVDGVIGTHTHQIQPLINIRNKPVFYSLGNFLFPDFYMKPPRPIWYPDENDDTENIKITNDYPFPIDTEMLRVWKSSARKGIIATVNVRNSKVISSFNTIRLTDSNFIIFHKENILNMLHLKMIGFLSTNKNLFLLRYYRAIMIRIKIVISKLRNLKQ